MGPQGFQDYHQVYLRTAISVDPKGWAHFEYVKLPDYRWGIFLAEPTPDRRIGFGQFKGQPAWQEVPGEFRNPLRRLIVTQGDTEPASVEQQRLLGRHCPSLYDLRNLFQVNVEEGRHLWAMVYLLHSYFGRDGRDEAEELLAAPQRQPGQAADARGLQFADRDVARHVRVHDVHRSRRQVAAAVALGERPRSAVADHALHADRGVAPPVRRRHRPRPHRRAHVPVDEGERASRRTCGRVGGIDLPTIQKHINFWFSQSLDLHGSEVSSNAATYFTNGLKGRAEEDKHQDDHVLGSDVYLLDAVDEQGRPTRQEVPMRNALNEVLRDWYVEDCRSGVERWNKRIASHGIDFRFTLPDRKFHRQIGVFSGLHFDPSGQPVDRGDVAAPPRRVAAVGGRQGVPEEPAGGAGLRAGKVRQLHCAAAARRQPAADRLRVRADRGQVKSVQIHLS